MSNRAQTKDKLQYQTKVDFENVKRKTEREFMEVKHFGSSNKMLKARVLTACECGNKTENRVCEKCGLVLRN